MIPHPIGDEPLERHDVHRRVGLGTVASLFAAMVAHPTADRGEWIVFENGAIGVGVASLGDERDIPLRALVHRTGVTARGSAALLDGVGSRKSTRLNFSHHS